MWKPVSKQQQQWGWGEIFFQNRILFVLQNFNVFQGVSKDEVLANRLLHFLMKHVFHPKRAVFRHNLEIIKTVVECWKECLSIPYRYTFAIS